MTAPRDIDQLVASYLEEGRDELSERAYTAVRAEIDNTRQRVVFGPWKEEQMIRFAQFGLAAAAVVLIAVVGVRLLPTNSALVGGSPTPIPTVTAAPTATVTTTPATPSPSPSALPDANGLLRSYLDAINDGNYAAAYAMLAPNAQQGIGTLAAFTSERTAFHESSGDAYTITTPTDALPLDEWLPVSQEPNLDRAYAVILEVDYPALAGNNAGYEIYVVGPVNGEMRIWPVR
jgi:hypothetical protein